MKKLIVIGAGGYAREVAYTAVQSGFEVLGFLDDDQSKHGKKISDFTCLGSINMAPQFSDVQFVVGIGGPRIRKKIVSNLSGFSGLQFATIIHPSAVVLNKNVKIGAGTIVSPGVVLTTDIQIGSHCILNINIAIGHDTVVEDFVTLNPHAMICGNCSIESGAEIGVGATLIQGMTLGTGAMIGAGGVVTRSIEPNSLAVGVPAKVIKTLQPF